jgi:hypothetical protein
MQQFGIPALYLPQLTAEKPASPSIPIFATSQELLKTKKSVIIILNDHMQDLGIWAYRKICDESFDAGSCTGTIKALKLRHRSVQSEPGIVILNPGQYFYSHKEQRALSHESWEALPKKSLYHPTVCADEMHNLVPGSRDRDEHVATVFENVLNNDEYVSPDADLYLVGISAGSNTLLKYMDKQWSSLSSRVKAAAWVHPTIQPDTISPELVRFIATRSRAWVLSAAPLGTCIGMPNHGAKAPPRVPDAPRNWEDQDEDVEEAFACPTFSGGEDTWTECLFPTAQKAMLDFFTEVRRGGKEFVNPKFEVVKAVEEQSGGDDAYEKDVAKGTKLKVVDVNGQGSGVPPVEKITKAIEKIALADDEVEVAGVAVAKDLLAKVGLD